MSFSPSSSDWKRLLSAIVSGEPGEIAAANLGCTVREWKQYLEDNPERAAEVENAGLLMLAKIQHQLQKQALNGQAGPAKQVLEAFDEKFAKKTAAEKNRAASEGVRYVVVSDIPPRKKADEIEETEI